MGSLLNSHGQPTMNSPCPSTRHAGSSASLSHGCSRGGIGDYFDDRPKGDKITLAAWLEHLDFYVDCRFAADAAFPFVALNMVYRRRAYEQSAWFLTAHLENAPLTAAEIQERLRAGDDPFLSRLRHFGGGTLRGTDAYWA